MRWPGPPTSRFAAVRRQPVAVECCLRNLQAGCRHPPPALCGPARFSRVEDRLSGDSESFKFHFYPEMLQFLSAGAKLAGLPQ